MPKGRMLNKRISKDIEVAKLSCKSALLYSWCIPHLDVEGRIEASPEIIKGVVVPYRKDFTLSVIKKCIEEIACTDNLIAYYGETHKYMQFLGFSKNQTLNKDREAPSEIPAPTPTELQSLSNKTPAKVKSKLNISKEKDAPQEIYEYYSKTIKPGAKEDAIRSIAKLLKTDLTKEDLLGRIDAYKQSILKSKKQDPEYYIQANNFFGRAARYKDFEPIKKVEYKDADPNCKLCKGQGKYLIQDTSEVKICRCRIK